MQGINAQGLPFVQPFSLSISQSQLKSASSLKESIGEKVAFHVVGFSPRTINEVCPSDKAVLE
jgi:hypothetical protein